jgi:hypothetical protein
MHHAQRCFPRHEPCALSRKVESIFDEKAVIFNDSCDPNIIIYPKYISNIAWHEYGFNQGGLGSDGALFRGSIGSGTMEKRV